MEELKCKLCDEDFSGSKIELYHDHLLREVHMNKAKHACIYYCELSSCGATSEDSFREHVGGKRHEKVKTTLLGLANRRNYDLLTGASNPASNDNTSQPKWVTTPNGPYILCPICTSTPCNSEPELERHMCKCRQKQNRMYSSDQVQQPPYVEAVSIKNTTETAFNSSNVHSHCDICDTPISGDENRKQHDNGQKHLKRKRMYEEEESMRRLGTMPNYQAASSRPEHPDLVRSHSQDSNISDADTIMSYATATSELSSIAALELTVANKLYKERQSPIESTIVSNIVSSIESEQNIYLERLHKRTDDDKPQYKKGRGYCLIINQVTFPDDKGGLRKGTVNVIGARPKTGKTLLADNIGIHIAKNGGRVEVVTTPSQPV